MRFRDRQLGAANIIKLCEMILSQFPQNRWRNPLVIMPDHVADTGDFFPRHVRMPKLQILRQMAAGFRKDFNPTLDHPLRLPIGLEVRDGASRSYKPYPFNRFDNVS